MSKTHGTLSITPGQLTRIQTLMLTALPKALRDLNPKDVIAWMELHGEETERALKNTLNSFIPPAKRVYTTLKYATTVEITTDAFDQRSFFGDDGPDNVQLSASFKGAILQFAPDVIPAIHQSISKFYMTDLLHNWELEAELGYPRPFSTVEVLAIMRDLLTTHSSLLSKEDLATHYLRGYDPDGGPEHMFLIMTTEDGFLLDITTNVDALSFNEDALFSR